MQGTHCSLSSRASLPYLMKTLKEESSKSLLGCCLCYEVFLVFAGSPENGEHTFTPALALVKGTVIIC